MSVPAALRVVPLEAVALDVEHATAWEVLCTTSIAWMRAILDEEPGAAIASPRADGGLWLAGGHSACWIVYDVPAGEWGWPDE